MREARVDQAFVELQVQDTEEPSRRPLFEWVERTKLRDFHLTQQRWYRDVPGSLGPLGDGSHTVRRSALEWLWAERNDPERTAALFILAGCENLARSHHVSRRSLDQFPVMLAARGRLGERADWHHRAAEIMPWGQGVEVDAFIEAGLAAGTDATRLMVELLAALHVDRLREYAPVALVFSNEMAPDVKTALDREDAERRAAHEHWQRKRAAELALREERRRELEKKRAKAASSPLAPEALPAPKPLSLVTRDELEKLVWSMPVTDLALHFEVSDVMVAKRCAALGVTKPPRGFWAKVRAGKLPHPKGRPQSLQG